MRTSQRATKKRNLLSKYYCHIKGHKWEHHYKLVGYPLGHKTYKNKNILHSNTIRGLQMKPLPQKQFLQEVLHFSHRKNQRSYIWSIKTNSGHMANLLGISVCIMSMSFNQWLQVSRPHFLCHFIFDTHAKDLIMFIWFIDD